MTPDVAAATFADKECLAGAEAMMWRERERSRKEKRAMELFFFLTSDASCGREFHSV